MRFRLIVMLGFVSSTLFFSFQNFSKPDPIVPAQTPVAKAEVPTAHDPMKVPAH